MNFSHLAEKSGNGSIPDLSTKVRVATDEAALEDYTFEEVSCMNKTVSYGVGTERGWETCSVGQPQAELKGSVGEGPNHSNYSDRSSVRILAKFRNFR